MLDFFVYEEDADTKFVCSVYELFAGSIQMLLDKGKYKYGLPISVVKVIVKQLLTALATLHTELKIIHTDIKPENILFRGIPEYQQTIIKLFEQSGFQKKYEDLRIRFNSDEARFNEELEILALDSIKEICSINIEYDGDEELIPDDETDEDDFIEGEDDSYDEDDSDLAFNERRQSIDDVIEHLDYTDMHNLEDENVYDFF